MFRRLELKDRWLFIPDALGLSFLTATSAQMGYEAGYPLIIVAILTTIASCFGGVLRDVLCQETPTIFLRNTPLYASLSFFGACFYYMLTKYFLLGTAVVLISTVFLVFISRLLVKRFNIVLRV